MHESKGERETSMSQLMEEILSRENMTLAYKKVRANKGASGVAEFVDESMIPQRKLGEYQRAYLKANTDPNQFSRNTKPAGSTARDTKW